ncbi:MAG TPA: hypothetical protein VMA74_14625 [Dyella sp.]|uniref:hypothetical protein n=1 Tax=Dyella sp. TaxID=1869338 RepID=UPI002BF8C30F|nr:hypothetical protein [Dyella sp.]HUB90957.1 hypothetical protein [Dyella sp.]
MSNSVLVTIEKGAQQLRVHVSALEEHLRLGWKKVEKEAEEVAEELEQELQGAEARVSRRGRRENADAGKPQA